LPAIVLSLIVGGWPAFAKFGPAFVIGTQWDPVREVFGALPTIYGTLVDRRSSRWSLQCLCPSGSRCSSPSCVRPWLKRPWARWSNFWPRCRAIIYGMWGLFVLAPLHGRICPALAERPASVRFR
jgi:phosphate transport system permease protein